MIRIFYKTPVLISLVVGLAALVLPVQAGAKDPVVVELFTSQSCYSCPSAEQYLSELADRPDLVTLEWHVDYWDTLVYGSKGKWKDPFSSFEYTTRQRRYNQSIRGIPNAYTPQVIVHGTSEATGSDRDEIPDLIRGAVPVEIGLQVMSTDQEISIVLGQVDIAQGVADVWLVRYLDQQSTDVPRGENAGKTLASRHVVRDIEKLGTWQGRETAFTSAAPAQGDGCAILVQLPDQGTIRAASYCR